MTRIYLLALVLVTGCSSLVDDHCATGYLRSDGTCVPRPEVDGGGPTVSGDARMPIGNFDPDPVLPPDASGDAGTSDGGSDAVADAGTGDGAIGDGGSGPTCTPPLVACGADCFDLETDPDHCGSCTHQCASGICTAGHCQGEPWGHIVAIGHDYTASHSAQRRVLANAVSLGASSDVGVAWFPVESASSAHVAALTTAMAAKGRSWHVVGFPATPAASFAGIDVVIVPPDDGDGDAADAAGATWATALDDFLRTGGVVVVLQGAGGVTYRFAHGAQLFDVGAPVTVTGQPTAIVDGTDAIADQVLAPYLAEASSVSWPGAP